MIKRSSNCAICENTNRACICSACVNHRLQKSHENRSFFDYGLYRFFGILIGLFSTDWLSITLCWSHSRLEEILYYQDWVTYWNLRVKLMIRGIGDWFKTRRFWSWRRNLRVIRNWLLKGRLRLREDLVILKLNMEFLIQLVPRYVKIDALWVISVKDSSFVTVCWWLCFVAWEN